MVISSSVETFSAQSNWEQLADEVEVMLNEWEEENGYLEGDFLG